MINTTLSGSSGKTYRITQKLTPGNRPNANLYYCEDESGNVFVAKHFYNGPTNPVVGYGLYNHYGRRRDGSHSVFHEIKAKAEQHDFLLKFYDRIKHNGKWIIVIEHVKGDLLSSFIREKHATDPELTQKAVSIFAKELKTWHSHGFAHGDPHLDNVMVHIDDSDGINVKLIDYSLLHHQDFYYCQQYNCFQDYDRIKEDLTNDSKMGKGFLHDLESLEADLDIGNELSACFLAHYNNY